MKCEALWLAMSCIWTSVFSKGNEGSF